MKNYFFRIVVVLLLVFSSSSKAATWEILGGTAYLYESSPDLRYNISVNMEHNLLTDYEMSNGYFGSIQIFNIPGDSARIDFGLGVNYLMASPYVDIENNLVNMGQFTALFQGWETFYSVSNSSLITNDDGTYTIVWTTTAGEFGPMNGTHWDMTLNIRDIQAQVVPVPSAVWLLGSGLLGLIGIARRKAKTVN